MSSRFGFLFDLDGVVVDSHEVHIRAWSIYLDRFGIAAESIGRQMHGRHNDDIVRELFGPEVAGQEVAAHGSRKEALYRELMGPQLAERLVPGIGDFLRRLRGSPVGLASNAEPENVDFVLDRSGLRQHFQAVIDGHQVARPKPHPDAYLRAAQALELAPRRCIVFEDSMAGIEAARSAGARVVGLTTARAELPGAELAIPDFRSPELHSWLDRALGGC